MSRLQDYLDSTQDVSLLVDGQKLDKWLEGFAKQNLLSYAVSANLESMRTYLKEVSLLEQTTSNAAEKFYSYIPTNWFGLPVETKGGKTYVNTYDGLIDLDNVQTSRYSYYSYSKKGDNPDEIKFADFMKYLDIEGLIKEWTGFDTFGADLNITKHGLDIQVAFNNSVRSEHDSRVPGKNKLNDVDPIVYLSVIVLLFVLSLLGIVVFKRVKEESQNQTEDQSFTPDYSDQPNNQTTENTSSFSDKIDKLI